MEPTDFPIRVTMPVAWGQLDAFGHVNNTQFFRFFEDARIACFTRIGVAEHMKATSVGPILAKTSCVFRRPLGFPDTVTVCTRVTELGEDRFTMEYALFSEKAGLAGHGEGRIVMLDYKTGQKTPIPAAIREAIEAL
ncbi:MAG TPA: thioesterase family protein [Myxococcota bacterium]|nr:thioesterase family protein [Myxococcota bacterium]